MSQEIRIHDGKLELKPGGVYDMKAGNYTEFAVAKLHLLIANIEKMIEIQCDCSEVQDERTPYGTELMAIAEKFYDSHYRDLVENYSAYKVEFNQADYNIPAFLLEAPWEDESWHNDACPSFVNRERRIKIWVEATSPDWREMHAQFYVVGGLWADDEHDQIDWDVELYETEDVDDLIRFLEEVKPDWG